MCGCRLEAWVDGCFRSQIICLRNEWVSRKCTWTPDRQVLCAVPGWSDTLFSCIRSFSAVCKKQKCWRNKSKLLHGWKKKKNLTQSWCDCQSLSSFHQMHIIFYQTLCSSGHKTQHMNSVCVSVCVSVCQCVSVCVSVWVETERKDSTLTDIWHDSGDLHACCCDTNMYVCMQTLRDKMGKDLCYRTGQCGLRRTSRRWSCRGWRRRSVVVNGP